MIGIYKITSPSKRVYIGQSIHIEERQKHYSLGYNFNEQPKLFNSINKYGWDKHKFEILTECEVSELNKWERYYQDLYSAIGKNGLNCKLTGYGDRCGEHSEETKAKMKANRKKAKPWTEERRQKHIMLVRGRKLSQETKDKISYKALNRSPEQIAMRIEVARKRKGIPNGRKGMPMSEETKAKLRTPKSQETKKKLSLARMGRFLGEKCASSKIVLNLEMGIYYECGREAAQAHNINQFTLKNRLNGSKNNKTSLIYA